MIRNLCVMFEEREKRIRTDGVPALSSLVTVGAAGNVRRVEDISAVVASDGDVVEGLGVSGSDLVEEGVGESKRGLVVGEEEVVDARQESSKDGSGGRGSVSNVDVVVDDDHEV